MYVKLFFKEGGEKTIENAHVAFNYGCLQIYVSAEGDSENPDCDMYPLSNLKVIEIREGKAEKEDRKKVVEIDRAKN